jgi:simple sugar transport system ATP-binding protein
VVSSASAGSVDERSLTAALLGEEAPGDLGPKRIERDRHASSRDDRDIARLNHVWVVDERGVAVVQDVSLSVRAGEILGIAAVEGSGQHALLRVLAARKDVTRGQAELPPKIGFVPEDRQREGLVLDLSLAENLALRGAGRRTGRIRWRAESAAAEAALREFDVRALGPAEKARVLSGGNQQKLVLARELSESPDLVVAENPTRGLDIRATRDVHVRLRRAADAGAAVVLYSSDLDEVLALSDRVVAMHAGALTEVAGDRDSVGRAMLGVA